MNLNHVFCLSGFGYLHDIFMQKEKVVARIKAVLPFNSGNMRQDEVWIDCEISNEYLSRLQQLHKLVQTGKAVLLTFKAEYKNFVMNFFGQMPSDPEHTVSLEAKLNLLENCYVNGELFQETKKVQLRAVA